MNNDRESFAPLFFLWLGILVCGAALFQWWPYRGYYFLSIVQRTTHPYHSFLRSSGKAGLTFGAVGTVLLFVNLTYLIRKQLIQFAWLGSLRSWIAFHVFTGLVAGAMVLLHSTFLLRSALGTLALTAMIVVLTTGLIGRYIYAHTPRSLQGQELDLADIRRNLADYQARLERMGMPHEFFQTILATPTIQGSDKGIVETLVGIVGGNRELRREQKSLRQMVRGRPPLRSLADQILPLADRYCRERQWATRYTELRSLMGSWRFFHRWFAIVLLSAVTFHIVIAFQMGNLWLVDFLKTLIHHRF